MMHFPHASEWMIAQTQPVVVREAVNEVPLWQWTVKRYLEHPSTIAHDHFCVFDLTEPALGDGQLLVT